jgi:hypothetical protein
MGSRAFGGLARPERLVDAFRLAGAVCLEESEPHNVKKINPEFPLKMPDAPGVCPLRFASFGVIGNNWLAFREATFRPELR